MSGSVHSCLDGAAPVALRDEFVARARALGAEVEIVAFTDVRQAILAAAGPFPGAGPVPTFDLAVILPETAAAQPADGETPPVVVGRGRAAVASTGSVLLAERDYRDRMLTLLCIRHIVVVPATGIVGSLREVPRLVRMLREHGQGRFATLVSGPSRTSDIERVLTVGVHGPRELVILLVEDWCPDET